MLNRGLRFFFGLIISGAALYYFLLVSPQDFWIISKANTDAMWLAFLVLIPAYIVRALKYHVILLQHKPGFFRLAAAQYAGIALNNLLPFRMGDVLRTLFVNKAMNIPFWAAVTSLLIERGFDLLFLLIFFSAFFLIYYSDFVFGLTLPITDVLLVTLSVLVALIFILQKRFNIWDKVAFFRARLKAFWPLNRSQTALVAFLSCVQWILEIFTLGAVLSLSIFGEVKSAALSSTFASNFSTLLPSTPGYLGTFEAAGILPFQYLGDIDMHEAASFVVLLHLSIWLFSTFLGIVSMLVVPHTLDYLKKNVN